MDEGDLTLKTDSTFVPLNNPQMSNPNILRTTSNQQYQVHGLGNGEI